MNRLYQKPFFQPLGLLLAGGLLFGTALAEEAAVPGPRTLVTINGQSISDIQVLAFNALQGNKPVNTQQAQIALLNQLVNTTLMAQAAEKEKLDDLPQVKAAIEMARLQVLAEAQVNSLLSKNPISDEEVKATYDKRYSGDNLLEFKVRHILVQEEDEAKKVIDALKKGEDFPKLAKEHSLDTSKDAGGELGWVGRNQVVKPFGDAMVKLEKGKYSSAPVKSQFGWHVIMVDDTRKQTPPPFDQVKQQLLTQLQQQKLAASIRELRNQAKIVVAEPDKAEEKKPADR